MDGNVRRVFGVDAAARRHRLLAWRETDIRNCFWLLCSGKYRRVENVVGKTPSSGVRGLSDLGGRRRCPGDRRLRRFAVSYERSDSRSLPVDSVGVGFAVPDASCVTSAAYDPTNVSQECAAADSGNFIGIVTN